MNAELKEGQRTDKAKKAAEKFGMNISEYSNEKLRAENAESIRDVSTALLGSSLYSFGSLLSGNSDQAFLMEMARAQVHQNWILIRQNEEIIRELKELNKK